MLRIKLKEPDTAKLIWNASPCTIPHVIPNPSISRQKRFHVNSIYYKDQVNKPKKVFTQFEKPQLLLINFRKQIEQVRNRARKAQKQRQIKEKQKSETITHRRKFMSTDVKFYEVPHKLDLKYDRHGCRSTYEGNYDIKEITQRHSLTQRNFFASQRVDLSKPENFYPGPGSYFKQNQEERFRSTTGGKKSAKYERHSLKHSQI